MARSKVSTPSGKKVTPKKKRDTKAKASVHQERVGVGVGTSTSRAKIVKLNDGDPGVYVNGGHSYDSDKAKRPNLIRNKSTSKETSHKAAIKQVKKKYPPTKGKRQANSL